MIDLISLINLINQLVIAITQIYYVDMQAVQHYIGLQHTYKK